MGAQARKKPKYRVRVTPRPLPKLPQVALRWVAAWAVAGLAVGILLMLLKAFPFAESGGKPDDASSFASWIPVMALAGAAAGLGVGLLYALLMTLTEEWRNSLEGDTLAVRLGPQVACGAAAGLVAGLLAGGLGGAAFFAGLGACTAAALNWRAARGI